MQNRRDCNRAGAAGQGLFFDSAFVRSKRPAPIGRSTHEVHVRTVSQRRQVAEFPPPFEDANRANVIDKEYQMWDTDSRETDPSLTRLQRNVD